MSSKSDKIKLALTTIAAVNGLAFSMGPQLKLTAQEIAKAWESKEFRDTLSAEQLSSLPENPAGDFIIKMPEKGHIEYIARSITDDCRSITDTCRSITDSCRSITDDCRSITDTCSTQFGVCTDFA